MTADDLIETRRLREKLTMRFPADPDTTRSLRLLSHEPLPMRRRVLRWIARRLARLL